MDSGRCRQCGRAFTAGEVTGIGILRPRPAAAGGPTIEFPCPGCRTVLRLVPHGNGRYAPPGMPPPPEPTAQERRLPWEKADESPDAPSSAAPRIETPRPPRPDRRGATAAAAHEREPNGTVPAPDPPLDAARALSILGVAAGASAAEIELAYRERALQCHPDKVAHLDADFVALAERKFRELAQARELLLGPPVKP